MELSRLKPELEMAQVPEPVPEQEQEQEQEQVQVPEPAQRLEQVLVAVVESPLAASASRGLLSHCIQRRPSSRMRQHRRHPHPKRGLTSNQHHHKDQTTVLRSNAGRHARNAYTIDGCQGSSLASR